MTQNTQTTAERIETWQRVERMMDSMLVVEHSEPYPHEDGTMGGEYSDYVYDEDHKFRNLIAAEIDALTRERDAARAEAERLRPAAEAWEAYDDYMMCPKNAEAEKFPVWVAAHKAAKSAQVARAAKEAKP
jgi:hypothetical protein